MIGETGKPAHIFVSHCHQPHDLAWCKTFVETLRAAALDVWCDQHNLGNGALGDVIAVSPQTPRKRLNTRLVFCALGAYASLSQPSSGDSALGRSRFPARALPV